MRKLVIASAALIAATACATSMASEPDRPSLAAPVLATMNEGQSIVSVIEAVLQKQVGHRVDLTSGRWLVVYGDRVLQGTEELASIDIREVISVHILTQPNRKYEGTLVLARR
jgi:hypothetical protein